MSNFCVICEFNPLHNGHAMLLRAARELGAKTVTCIMSGNATQRGELALLDKYKRAEAALRCGADMVLELGYPWCAASADFFASGALSVAEGLCDTLLFGSECGDIDYLCGAAEVCEGENFAQMYEQSIKTGRGAAAAYLDCLAELGYDRLGSNDLLAVAYIRVIRRRGLNIRPMTIKREGAQYNQSTISESPYQSATAIRALSQGGDFDKIAPYVPEPMLKLIKEAASEGELTDAKLLDDAVLCFFRLKGAEELCGIADTEGGIANRLVAAAKQSTSSAEMLEALRTKRYTDAKLRRAILFSMTGVRREYLCERPQYTVLLAANARGRELLRGTRKAQRTAIVTKPADAPVGCRQYECSRRLDEIFSLARRKKSTVGEFLKNQAYIEK